MALLGVKKSNIEYSSIESISLIKHEYNLIRRKIRNKSKVINFELFKESNLSDIYRIIKNKNYIHGKYNIFLIKDPKLRVIMSENIHDKVINHVVGNNILKPVLYRKMIDENVATRPHKGTRAAYFYAKKYFNSMGRKYKRFYILKFDIEKYFYNIDHEVLKDMLKDIYLDKDILNLLYRIIDSTNMEYINKEIDYLSKKYDVDLPRYTKNKGLGIGSLTSQVFACFYLNGLDHYIKDTLGIKEYVRYMDDGIIMHNDIKFLYKVKDKIEDYLWSRLKLRLNSKTKIYSSFNGIEFVGFKFRYKDKLSIKLNKRNYLKVKRYGVDKYGGLLSYIS